MAEATGSPVRRARRLQQPLELEMEAGAAAPLQAARMRACALLDVYKDVELQASLDRSDAELSIAAADTDSALLALRRVIDNTKPGRVQALARMDAAWLLGDQGEAAAVTALLLPIGPWMGAHPVGRALAQRLGTAGAPATPLRRLPSLR